MTYEGPKSRETPFHNNELRRVRREIAVDDALKMTCVLQH